MSKSKTSKRHRLWKPADLARVANHLRAAGYDEELIYLSVRSESRFTLDDIARSLEPRIGIIKGLRTLRRVLKLIAALLAVVIVLSGGTASVFLIPLEAELFAVIVGVGLLAAEIKRHRNYVLAVRHVIGQPEEKDILDDIPDEEEIDNAIKEADDLAAKINKLIDGADVVFD